MELPHLGDHCSDPTCKKLDFLPVKCDGCPGVFCNDHYHYANHNCPSAYKKNVQVPVCPLCNTPIPVSRGQSPDIAVGAHIDADCQSDPAKTRRKVFTNRCTMKGCRTKEIVPILCSECTLNYCLKHRHPTDHNCAGKTAALRNNTSCAAQSRLRQSTISSITAVQGTMDEDEALARAIALSIQEPSNKMLTQEQMDEALARQLQQQEQATTARSRNTNSGRSDRCLIS